MAAPTATATAAAAASPLASPQPSSSSSPLILRRATTIAPPLRRCRATFRHVSVRAILDDRKTTTTTTEEAPPAAPEKSESDKLVDGLNFGELCNDFECNSSPSIEATARQLVRDILEIRQGNRALGSFAISVKYKDPIRSFTGREKYKRTLWATDALQNPSVTVQEMAMLSTSVLNIKWTIRGKAKTLGFIDVIVRVNSKFTMNQISGQVTEHEEHWDLSMSSPPGQAYFWLSRFLFSATEAGKDTVDAVKNKTTPFSVEKENANIYPDPMGDPTKFFQMDDGFQRDAYQFAIFLAVVYLVFQFLRTTL